MQYSPLSKNIPVLTSIRGFAALLVFFYHLAGYFPVYDIRNQIPLIGQGYLAVDFFFVLSGFIMAHVHWGDFSDKISVEKLSNFIKLRLARIYPLHIFTLFVFVFLYIIFGLISARNFGTTFAFEKKGIFSIEEIVRNILMFQGWNSNYMSWNGVSWSIGAEFIAYLCFPFFVIFMAYYRKLIFIIVPFCFIALLWLNIHHGKISVTYGYGLSSPLLRCLPEFIIGMALCRLAPFIHFKKPILAALTALTGFFLIFALAKSNFNFFIVFLMIFFILFASLDKSSVSGFLSKEPFMWLGRISFSLYMVHIPIIYTFNELGLLSLGLINDGKPGHWGFYYMTALGAIVLSCAITAVVILLADLSYRYIEKPSRNYLRKHTN